MIPKIIHYCWFGTKPKPASFEKFLQSWKKYLPDYEIIEWNERNFDVSSYVYSREAYLTRNWAFVSDVCRIHALSLYGGIYLDTDVEICRNLDDLLTIPNGFMGWENSERIGTGLIAADKGAAWIGRFLQYYRDTHFINIWGHPHRTPNTAIFTFKIYPAIPESGRPRIFPLGYIAGIDCCTREPLMTPDTIAVHHWNASWTGKKTLATRIRNLKNGFIARYFNR